MTDVADKETDKESENNKNAFKVGDVACVCVYV